MATSRWVGKMAAHTTAIAAASSTNSLRCISSTLWQVTQRRTRPLLKGAAPPASALFETPVGSTAASSANTSAYSSLTRSSLETFESMTLFHLELERLQYILQYPGKSTVSSVIKEIFLSVFLAHLTRIQERRSVASLLFSLFTDFLSFAS